MPARERLRYLGANSAIDNNPPIAGCILIVEHFQPYRTFVAALVNRHFELQEVVEASEGLEAVDKARQLKPDLV